MIDDRTMRALLDGLAEPIVFADNDHVIRYVNRAAAAKYRAKGYGDLLGTSLMDCHNPESREKLRRIHAQLEGGLDEVFEAIDREGRRVFVRAVRDEAGRLLGYYQRYEAKAE